MRASLMTILALLSLLGGTLYGLSFGAGEGATLEFLGFSVLAGTVFWLRARRQWLLLLLCCATFWLAAYAVGLRWIAATLMAPDTLGFALGGLLYFMLIAGLSLLSIVFLTAATALSAPIRSEALCCALLSSASIGAELLRELLLPSFPWLCAGYAQIDSPFAALLPLVGIQGVSWAVQFCALLLGALGVSLANTRRVQWATLAMLAVVALGVGVAPRMRPLDTRASGSLRVAVMQTAVPIRDKFRASLFAKQLTAIGDFVQAHEAQLVLTPESAVPTTLRSLTPAQEHFLETNVTPTRALLFGAFAEDSRGDIFNSAVMLQRAAAGEPVQRTVYIKQHLAPVGEYAPPGFGWIADLLHIPVANQRSTEDTPRNFQLAGITIIPSVCQDLLYGNDLRTTTTAPRILVNLTNVAFFEHALARRQFLNVARARALEQQVPVLIAANFGPTALIDADGKLQRQLPADASGALEVTVQTRAATTIYARFGNLFLNWTIILSGFAALAVAVRRQPNRRADIQTNT